MNFKQRRKALNLTQSVVAEFMGMTTRQYQSIEAMEEQPLKYRRLMDYLERIMSIKVGDKLTHTTFGPCKVVDTIDDKPFSLMVKCQGGNTIAVFRDRLQK